MTDRQKWAAQVSKLDRIINQHWPCPDPQAANIVMRAMRQRAQLLGVTT